MQEGGLLAAHAGHIVSLLDEKLAPIDMLMLRVCPSDFLLSPFLFY